jgi:hypothetical protein
MKANSVFKRNSVIVSSLHTNSLINPDNLSDEFGGKLTKKKRHVAVYSGSKISARSLNRLLIDKGWNFNTFRSPPLANSETEHHWVLLKSLAPDNKTFQLRMKIASEEDMKKAEGLPKCNYPEPSHYNYSGNFEESFRQGLQMDNDSIPEMENLFQNFPETTSETLDETSK